MDNKELKKELRKDIKAKLESLDAKYIERADSAIVKSLCALPEYVKADTVFCFVGVGMEINTRPFLQHVLDSGKRLTVPLCTGKGIMEAKQISSLEELKNGQFGLLEPDASARTIDMSEVDFAVIPCLAADHKGNRIGYGGGFYDRMFEKNPDVPAAIICREKIMREDIPLEPFDHRFPISISEEKIYRF